MQLHYTNKPFSKMLNNSVSNFFISLIPFALWEQLMHKGCCSFTYTKRDLFGESVFMRVSRIPEMYISYYITYSRTREGQPEGFCRAARITIFFFTEKRDQKHQTSYLLLPHIMTMTTRVPASSVIKPDWPLTHERITPWFREEDNEIDENLFLKYPTI